jgi:hypothetical protein
MDSITANNSRWKYVGLAAMCAPFVVIGALMLIFPRSGSLKETLIGWLSVIFFGFGLIIFLRQIFDSRPRIVVDERGVFDRTLSVGTIEWQDIEHAYLNSVVGNPFISLRLNDPEKYLERAMNSQKKLARLNKYLGAETININVSGINKSPDEILAVVLKNLLDRKTKNHQLSENQ